MKIAVSSAVARAARSNAGSRTKAIVPGRRIDLLAVDREDRVSGHHGEELLVAVRLVLLVVGLVMLFDHSVAGVSGRGVDAERLDVEMATDEIERAVVDVRVPGSTWARVSTSARRTEPYDAVRGSLMAPILPHSRSHGVELGCHLHRDIAADRLADGAVLRRIVHQRAQLALCRRRRHGQREVARSQAMVAGEVTACLSDIPHRDQVVRRASLGFSPMSARTTLPALVISASPRPRDSRVTLRDPLALPDGPWGIA
jgi:hypothetical protein